MLTNGENCIYYYKCVVLIYLINISVSIDLSITDLYFNNKKEIFIMLNNKENSNNKKVSLISKYVVTL